LIFFSFSTQSLSLGLRMFEELIRAVGHSGTEQKRMKDTDYKLIAQPS